MSSSKIINQIESKMNQSQQLAHLMNNYSSTNEQVLQQYLASASTFPHSAHSALALHSMAAMNGSTSLLNNLSSFSTFNNLAAAMAQRSTTALTSSPLSSTNSSTISSTGLSNQTTGPMFAALLQAQQHLNGLNGLTSNLNGLSDLNASSLLQKYDQQNNNSQQSPSSASNCSSPPTCSSVTPPTPPPNVSSVNPTTLQLLAAQHYQQLPLSAIASTTNSIVTNTPVTTSVSSISAIPASLSETAAALLSQPNLSSLVANSQSLIESSAASKRLATSPDTDASNEMVDIQQVQQYYNQLNALRLLSSAGLTSFNSTTNAPSIKQQTLLPTPNQQQPPLKDLARLYSAINYNSIADLNSPINSSLSSSSSSTNSLQNTMTSLQQQHTQMMAAMASTGTFTNSSGMNLLSPNSISLKFSIENILKKSSAPSSLGTSTADLAAALNQQATTNSLITNHHNSPMSKLFEFNKQKNGLNSSTNPSNKLSHFLNSNSNSTKPNLEQCSSTINNLSSLVNNINPLDFKLNTSKRKKRCSSSMDDSCDLDLTRSVKRKNSIDSDCSNSNSSISQTKLMNNAPSENGSIKIESKTTSLKSPDSPKDNDKPEKLPSEEDIKEGKAQLPAWVFCTRYSDRPSSGKLFFGKIFV